MELGVLSSESDGSDEEYCIPFCFKSSELLVSSPLISLVDLGGMFREFSNEEFEDVNFDDCNFNLKMILIYYKYNNVHFNK